MEEEHVSKERFTGDKIGDGGRETRNWKRFLQVRRLYLAGKKNELE